MPKHDKRLQIFSVLFVTREEYQNGEAADREQYMASDLYLYYALGGEEGIDDVSQLMTQYEQLYGSVVALNDETLRHTVHLMLPACRQQVLRVMDERVLHSLSHIQVELDEVATEHRQQVLIDTKRSRWPLVGWIFSPSPSHRVLRLSKKFLHEVITEQAILGLELTQRLVSRGQSMSFTTFTESCVAVVAIAKRLEGLSERPKSGLAQHKLLAFEREYRAFVNRLQAQAGDITLFKPVRFSGFRKGRLARQKYLYLQWRYSFKNASGFSSQKSEAVIPQLLEQLKESQATLNSLSSLFQRSTKTLYSRWQASLVNEGIQAILSCCQTDDVSTIPLGSFKNVLPHSLYSALEKIVNGLGEDATLEISVWKEVVARINQCLPSEKQFFLPLFYYRVAKNQLRQASMGANRDRALTLMHIGVEAWVKFLEGMDPSDPKHLKQARARFIELSESRIGEAPGYELICDLILRHTLVTSLAPHAVSLLTQLSQDMTVVKDTSQREFLRERLSYLSEEKSSVAEQLALQFTRACSTERWHLACQVAQGWVQLFKFAVESQSYVADTAYQCLSQLASLFVSRFIERPPRSMTSCIQSLIATLLSIEKLPEHDSLAQLQGPISTNALLTSVTEVFNNSGNKAQALMQRLPQWISQITLACIEKHVAGESYEWPAVLFPLTRRELEVLADFNPRDPRGQHIVALWEALLDTALLPKALTQQVKTLIQVFSDPDLRCREQAIDQYLDGVSRESIRKKSSEASSRVSTLGVSSRSAESAIDCEEILAC